MDDRDSRRPRTLQEFLDKWGGAESLDGEKVRKWREAREGQDIDSALQWAALERARRREPGDWVATLEAKHGMPVDQIPGMVYVLHYPTPQVVESVSRDYAGPNPRTGRKGLVSGRPGGTRHYVGWTSQKRPSSRYCEHGPAALRELVYLEPGTTRDEGRLKREGNCPKCGEPYAADLLF